MKINKNSPGHSLNDDITRNYKSPPGYSYDALKRGFEATTGLKKPKALIDMANSPTRDNAIYARLDAEYIRSIKKERR